MTDAYRLVVTVAVVAAVTALALTSDAIDADAIVLMLVGLLAPSPVVDSDAALARKRRKS